jgi:hypothetical protein
VVETTEKIPVYIDIKKGRTVCICHAKTKRCKKPCTLDTVDRDKFREWEKVMKRDRYGR